MHGLVRNCQIVIIFYWFVLFCKYDILLIPGPTLFNSSIVGNFRIKWRKVDWWISNVPPVCNRTRQFLFCPMRCPRFWDATANQHVRNLRISEFPRSRPDIVTRGALLRPRVKGRVSHKMCYVFKIGKSHRVSETLFIVF